MNRPNRKAKQRLRSVLLVFFAAVLVFSAMVLLSGYLQETKEENALKQLAAIAESSTSSSPASGGTPGILAQYRELHERNADMVGWVKINGTVIDYPVMYTADDFYLSHGFDKETSKSGVPFIDKRCMVAPFGTNTIIYGHHMKSGAMFAGLENYKNVEYYKEHPTIRFDTLYEQQEYEIIAVLESKIYRKSDTVFKHYNFLNTQSEAAFNEYITNIKALSLYDTGVTASYGDELLTLVTCSYQTENGQFVVVARKAS